MTDAELLRMTEAQLRSWGMAASAAELQHAGSLPLNSGALDFFAERRRHLEDAAAQQGERGTIDRLAKWAIGISIVALAVSVIQLIRG